MKIDFKKKEPQLYAAAEYPTCVDIPEQQLLVVTGKGNPNASIEFNRAIQQLYAVAYTIKMWYKVQGRDYVVMPLEGIWQSSDEEFKGQSGQQLDKESLLWVLTIRQPYYVAPELFADLVHKCALKKPELGVTAVKAATFPAGRYLQALHIGAYDKVGDTVQRMNKFATENNIEYDFGGLRQHRELYLSDPRKVEAEKLRTIVRHPIK